jgi:hypothetical protein
MQSTTRYHCYYRRDVQEIRLDGQKMAISKLFFPWNMTTFDQFFQKKFLYNAHYLSLCFFSVGKWHKNAVWLLVIFPYFSILMSRGRCPAPISLWFADVHLRRCAEVPIFLYFLSTRYVETRLWVVSSDWVSSSFLLCQDIWSISKGETGLELFVKSKSGDFIWAICESKLNCRLRLWILGSSGLTTWRFQLLLLCLQKGKVEWELDRERERESERAWGFWWGTEKVGDSWVLGRICIGGFWILGEHLFFVGREDKDGARCSHAVAGSCAY